MLSSRRRCYRKHCAGTLIAQFPFSKQLPYTCRKLDDRLMTYTPFFIHGEDRPSRWLITCDHATNTVPPEINGGDLGLPREDMERHIAYDVGAYEVSKHLGELLNAPVIACQLLASGQSTRTGARMIRPC